jgi:DUF1009 family protein
VRKLGILAGKGELPARLIAACRASQRPFFVLAFEGQTDVSLVAGVDHGWCRLGAAGTAFKLLRDHGVEELVMAGRMTRPSLAELRPDLRATRFFAKVGVKALGDDGLLSAVVREIEAEGFGVIGPDSVLADLIAPAGVYTSHSPDAQAQADIAHGARVARSLGALDVGQAVVVQQGLVLGVEAIEGTDALLARCATLHREGPGGVLVKMSKPGQERRADLPTVGVATVSSAAAAGLRGIAVEAGHALIVDRHAVAAAADEAGLFVIGIEETE